MTAWSAMNPTRTLNIRFINSFLGLQAEVDQW